jgi:hypothetical protein
VRILSVDDGNTSINWWNTSPVSPLFQASGSGIVLRKLTTSLTGEKAYTSNRLFDLYPNPTSDYITIINKVLISEIEILDSKGKLILTGTNSRIDVSGLSSGVYFVKAYSLQGTVTQKFVKN